MDQYNQLNKAIMLIPPTRNPDQIRAKHEGQMRPFDSRLLEPLNCSLFYANGNAPKVLS